ncbi:MAG: diguanylate cyclase [Longimicrobiales bacterium]|nr:diguanylate cyclase [Longimicrobiales bacterium]
MVNLQTSERRVPARAAVLSLGALAIPILGATIFPEALGDYAALLWLTALIPAFLFAYYRGWQGAATALALGMATLSTTEAVSTWLGSPVPDLLLGIVIAYVAITMGIGWLAEILHRDRDEVEELAFTDALTRLPNRRHAEVFLENEFAAAARGRPLSVVLFDLDRFKAFNDSLGHEAGDAALEAFADVLIQTTRRMNLSARFGGEEFISILAGTDLKGATIFAERVRSGLAALRLGSGGLTVSAGVAAYDGTHFDPKELIASADRALYEAKRDGRDRVRAAGVATSEGADAWIEDEAEEEDAAVRLAPHHVAPLGEGRSALVVEEDAQLRGLLVTYLEASGFSVAEASDGDEAIRALAREFDLVVIELRLKRVHGHEIIRAVKSRHPTTQVFVITALQDAHIAADALHAGANRYLFKPFAMPELQAHLVDALKHRDHLLAQEERRRELTPEGIERANAAHDAILGGTRALVRAVEVRDPYTAGASTRVAAYAEILADALDPDAMLLPREMLRIGCEVHDVGKIGVPDGVLNKAGALDPVELAEMRKHPEIGRSILEPIIDDPIVLAVTSWHHERWDGTGYPDGLRAEAIPLAARVVAVADALNALTRPRAWRAARSWEEAMKIICDASATAFDPDVVTAVVELQDALKEI